MKNVQMSGSPSHATLGLIRFQETEPERISILPVDSVSLSSNDLEVVNLLIVTARREKDRMPMETESILCPRVVDGILESALRFHNWDCVPACNYCLTVMIAKVCRRGRSATTSPNSV
jgi:hypothetical protein